MKEEGSSVNEDFNVENAARAREAGWLGFATLVAVLMVYFCGWGFLWLFFHTISMGPDEMGTLWIGEDSFFAFVRVSLPILLSSHLIILYFILRVGRRRGIGFYHHGESADGVIKDIYLLISALVLLTILSWVLFSGNANYLINNVPTLWSILMAVGVANMIPAWARLLEWSRKRWGKSLVRLGEGKS
jgi:hypothetical protein